MEEKFNSKKNFTILLGAAFLMATSAIGPGFLVQTGTFTSQLGSDFGLLMLVAIIFSLIAQVNIWRVIGVSGKPAQDISNEILPGLGHFIAVLVVFGGLAFNIGNIGGAALGLNVITGLSLEVSAIISLGICIVIFLSKELGKTMDKLSIILGAIMLILISYVALISKPPVGEVIERIVVPRNFVFLPVLTLIGGTVGGYTPFSGAYRLLDAGITGEDNIKDITKSSYLGIVISSVVRILLFLAILGVVKTGAQLDPNNAPADAFRIAAGNLGYKLFGIVLFAAAVSSVVGSAYTSISFLKTLSKTVEKHFSKFVIGLISIATIIFVIIGRPASLLILAGSLNGLILPVTLSIILLASKKKSIVGENYKHSNILFISGIFVVLITLYTGIQSLGGIASLFK